MYDPFNLQCMNCGSSGWNEHNIIDGLCPSCREDEIPYCNSCGALFELECCCDSDEDD